MPLLEDTLAAFHDPNQQPNLADCLLKYAAAKGALHHDFFTITLDKQVETLHAPIQALLKKYAISPDQYGRYLDQKITVYQCLVELNDVVKNDELTAFIKSLDELQRARWKGMLLVGLLGFVAGAVPLYAFQLTLMQQVLTVATVITGGGFVYSIVVAAYTAYEASLANQSFLKTLWDNFFIVAKNALVIAAWSILLISAVSTPVVAILFVVGDAVLVIQESLRLASMYWSKKPIIDADSPLSQQQTQAREQTNFESRQYAAIVHLVAAILMTAIIAAWCFTPGGWVVAAGSLVAIGALYLTKYYVMRENEKNMKQVMLTRFEALEDNHHKKLENALKSHPDASTNAQMQEALCSPQTGKVYDAIMHTHPTEDSPIHTPGLLQNSFFAPAAEQHLVDVKPESKPGSQKT